MKKLLLVLLLLFPVHGAKSITINKHILKENRLQIYWNADASDFENGKTHIYCSISDNNGNKIGGASRRMRDDFGSIVLHVPSELQTDNMKLARKNVV